MRVDVVSPQAHRAIQAAGELPWNTPAVADLYGTCRTYVCRLATGQAVGVWVVPLDNSGGGPAARRHYRLLPYASPWVDTALHPSRRHQVVLLLVNGLLADTGAVDLPMSPGFSEMAALLEAGADVRFRHTRMLRLDGEPPQHQYSSTVRNHIRHAGERCHVVSVSAERFNFGRAVVGAQPPGAIAARQTSGLALESAFGGVCLAAQDATGACFGQVFVLKLGRSAVLMHSWFQRGSIRGVPTLLTDAAIRWACQQRELDTFDFEGSVIPKIDQFMAAFGAEAVPFGQLQWFGPLGDRKPASEFG